MQTVKATRGKLKIKDKTNSQKKGALLEKEIMNMLNKNRYSPLVIHDDNSSKRRTEGVSLNEVNPP